MSEKKKEPKYYNEKTWKLDCRLALRQRACWVVCAAAAIGGGALIMRCFPQGTAHWVIIVWALLLMTGYQWVSRAPVRALSGWMGQRNAGETDRQAALSYVEALEKKLPGMKRKEMAFLLTNARGCCSLKRAGSRRALIFCGILRIPGMIASGSIWIS